MTNTITMTRTEASADSAGFVQNPDLAPLVESEIYAANWVKSKLPVNKFTDRNIHIFMLRVQGSLLLHTRSEVDLADTIKAEITEFLCRSLRIRIIDIYNGKRINGLRLLNMVGAMLRDLREYNDFAKTVDSQNWVINYLTQAMENDKKKKDTLDRITACFGLPASKSVVIFRNKNIREFVTNNWHGQRPVAAKVETAKPVQMVGRSQLTPPSTQPAPALKSSPPVPPSIVVTPDGRVLKMARPPKPQATTPIVPPPPPLVIASAQFYAPTKVPTKVIVQNTTRLPALTQPAMERPETVKEFSQRLQRFLKPHFDVLKTNIKLQSSIIDMIARNRSDYLQASGKTEFTLSSLREELDKLMLQLGIESKKVGHPVKTTFGLKSDKPRISIQYDGAKIKTAITRIIPLREAPHATSLPLGLAARSRDQR